MKYWKLIKEQIWKENLNVALYECAAKEAEKQHKKAHYVICDDYVTMSDGTGIVHIAPAFGEDDAVWVVNMTFRWLNS